MALWWLRYVKSARDVSGIIKSKRQQYAWLRRLGRRSLDLGCENDLTPASTPAPTTTAHNQRSNGAFNGKKGRPTPFLLAEMNGSYSCGWRIIRPMDARHSLLATRLIDGLCCCRIDLIVMSDDGGSFFGASPGDISRQQGKQQLIGTILIPWLLPLAKGALTRCV